MTTLPPPNTSTTTPWENLDRSLSRLESAILTQKQHTMKEDTKQAERLQRENTQLKATLRQTLADIRTILKT